MFGTFAQVSQGVLTGLGLVAATAGLVYVASFNGFDVQLRLSDATFSLDPVVQQLEVASPEAGTADEGATGAGAASRAATRAPATPAPRPTQRTLPVQRAPAQVANRYYDQVAPDLSLQVVSLKRLGVLLQNPQVDDPSWRNEVARLSGLLDESYRRLSWVRPDHEAMALHGFVIEATSRCLTIVNSLGGDLTQLDADTVRLIGGTMRGCTSDVSAALKSIQ